MMTADKPILYLVVPCYNEEEVLPETSRRLREKLTALTAEGRWRLSSSGRRGDYGLLF